MKENKVFSNQDEKSQVANSIEIDKKFKPLLLLFSVVVIFVVCFEWLLVCQNNYEPINIFQSIFGLISFKDSLLPEWLFIVNTIVGIFINVFILGLLFTYFLAKRDKPTT
jgi:hypothetical protein